MTRPVLIWNVPSMRSSDIKGMLSTVPGLWTSSPLYLETNSSQARIQSALTANHVSPGRGFV